MSGNSLVTLLHYYSLRVVRLAITLRNCSHSFYFIIIEVGVLWLVFFSRLAKMICNNIVKLETGRSRGFIALPRK